MVDETNIKTKIAEAMKTAMRSKDKQRLAVIRLMQAAFKQVEVDKRIAINDSLALEILSKMLKQRQESIKQYIAANRNDLAEQEQYEVKVIQEFMPVQLSAIEVSELIQQAISEQQASSMRDMGKVMQVLRPKLQGRADMAKVSDMLKEQLSK